jgi:hypothetical protein
MRVGLSESYPGELEELGPLGVMQKAEAGLHAALRDLGHPEAAAALAGRLDALLDAERALTDVYEAGELRKALPPRGGELDVVQMLADRMGGAYDAMAARLEKRLREAVDRG